MKLTRFLLSNAKWALRGANNSTLVCLPTTEEQYFAQMQRLSERYFPMQKNVETQSVEFCLNAIALKTPRTSVQKQVFACVASHWQTYVRLARTLDKPHLTFPADSTSTRIEQIAKLYAKCTAFLPNGNKQKQLLQLAHMFDLNESEQNYLEDVVELFKIRHFCAIAQKCFEGDVLAQQLFAKGQNLQLLKFPFEQNKKFCYSCYRSANLQTAVDCMGNSAVQLNGHATNTTCQLFLYSNGRNVFDTFVESKFGEKTAEFRSVSGNHVVESKYFLHICGEVRKIHLANNSSNATKLTISVPFSCQNNGGVAYFPSGNAVCMAVQGKHPFYCAIALVADNKILPSQSTTGLLYSIKLQPKQNFTFDVVTVFATDMPTVATQLENLQYFGATLAPYVEDQPSKNTLTMHTRHLHLSPHGYLPPQTTAQVASRLQFSYQLGDGNVATFLDNNGRGTTLLQGFAFGVGGEKVFCLAGNKAEQINVGKFCLDGNSATYNKTFGKNNVCCKLHHDGSKTYEICYTSPTKTLFVLPFEKPCKVEKRNNVFVVNGSRNFCIVTNSKVESYTSDGLECNHQKVRFALSNSLEQQDCLAICFEKSTHCSLQIVSQMQHFAPTPLIKESLLSTYLNYLNNKAVFCLQNHLRAPNALEVTATCFTTPQFTAHYVAKALKCMPFYYDKTGKRQKSCDKFVVPLASVYLALVSDLDISDYVGTICVVAFDETLCGFDRCLQALLLKKMCNLPQFDKVRCLVMLEKLKPVLQKDPLTNEFCQALGVFPLAIATKEYLSKICHKHNVPKSWYYVSQLENLYGISISQQRLYICPATESPLEQLCLNVCGKQFDTTFTKSTTQEMLLNGCKCGAFSPQQLTEPHNTLVVNY